MWDENREERRGDFVPESHQRRATLSEKPETLDSGWDYVDEQAALIERKSEYLLSFEETDEDYRTKESRLAEKPETLRQLCEGGWGAEKWCREGDRSIKIEAFIRVEKNSSG